MSTTIEEILDEARLADIEAERSCKNVECYDQKRLISSLTTRDAQIRSKAIEIIDNAISDPAERQLAKDIINDLV